MLELRTWLISIASKELRQSDTRALFPKLLFDHASEYLLLIDICEILAAFQRLNGEVDGTPAGTRCLSKLCLFFNRQGVEYGTRQLDLEIPFRPDKVA